MQKKYMLLYGKKSILERLKTNPQSIRQVFFENNFQHRQIEGLVKSNKIKFEYLSSRKIENIKRAKNVQGIVARVEVFKYADYEALLDQAEKNKLSLIFLDGINDPQNLGVIIRSLACFGNFAVVIPDKNACGVTDAVMHVASGGENYISVARVSSLPEALKKAGKHGIFIAGAAIGPKTKNIQNVRFSFPLGLVLGSEDSGISPEVESCLDEKIQIEMQGAQLSLNVSMACTVFCHEIAKQYKYDL